MLIKKLFQGKKMRVEIKVLPLTPRILFFRILGVLILVGVVAMQFYFVNKAKEAQEKLDAYHLQKQQIVEQQRRMAIYKQQAVQNQPHAGQY